MEVEAFFLSQSFYGELFNDMQFSIFSSILFQVQTYQNFSVSTGAGVAAWCSPGFGFPGECSHCCSEPVSLWFAENGNSPPGSAVTVDTSLFASGVFCLCGRGQVPQGLVLSKPILESQYRSRKEPANEKAIKQCFFRSTHSLGCLQHVIKHCSPAWYLLMLCLLREVSTTKEKLGLVL